MKKFPLGVSTPHPPEDSSAAWPALPGDPPSPPGGGGGTPREGGTPRGTPPGGGGPPGGSPPDPRFPGGHPPAGPRGWLGLVRHPGGTAGGTPPPVLGVKKRGFLAPPGGVQKPQICPRKKRKLIVRLFGRGFCILGGFRAPGKRGYKTGCFRDPPRIPGTPPELHLFSHMVDRLPRLATRPRPETPRRGGGGGTPPSPPGGGIPPPGPPRRARGAQFPGVGGVPPHPPHPPLPPRGGRGGRGGSPRRPAPPGGALPPGNPPGGPYLRSLPNEGFAFNPRTEERTRTRFDWKSKPTS